MSDSELRDKARLANEEDARNAARICGNCGQRRDNHINIDDEVWICPRNVFSVEPTRTVLQRQ